MEGKRLKGVQGWLWVYVIGSIPLMVVYSMGLSGWFFEYPIGLMLAIFLVLAIPLLLLLLKSPRAPRWNYRDVVDRGGVDDPPRVERIRVSDG